MKKNKHTLRTRFKKEIVAEFLPPVKKSNKVVILCGGIPSYPGNKTELAGFLSNKGYWVFLPRYRGSWESGGKFLNKSLDQDIFDVMEGIERGFTDLWDNSKHRVLNPKFYLIGSSFGGPAVLLNSKNKRVEKVVCFSPVVNWEVEVKERNKKDRRNFKTYTIFVKVAFGEGYRTASGGWNKIKSGKFYNPANNLKKIDGDKILILHSKSDDVVWFDSVKDFSDKIKCKLISIKGDEHFGVSDSKRFWPTISKFFKN